MKNWMRKYSIFILSVVALTIWGVFATAEHEEGTLTPLAVTQPQEKVCTQVVAPLQESPVRHFPAVIHADQVSDLAFCVGGPLVEVLCHPGKQVKAGEVLMRIDPRDFQHQLNAAKAKLRAARARLKVMRTGARTEDIEILEARLESARAQRDYAEAEWKRATPLLKKNAISRSEIELMESQYRVAKATIRSLEQELCKARKGERTEEIDVMEAEIAHLEVQVQIAQAQLDDTCLRAPFDGVVTTQRVQNYEIVRPGTPVLTIMDVSRLEVEIWVSENDILHSHANPDTLSGQVAFPNHPGKSYEATFKKAEPSAHEKTRAWRVVLSMPSPEDLVVLPGMSAEVTLNFHTTQWGERIVIPVSAIHSDVSRKHNVWICNAEHRTEKREVRLGTGLSPFSEPPLG